MQCTASSDVRCFSLYTVLAAKQPAKRGAVKWRISNVPLRRATKETRKQRPTKKERKRGTFCLFSNYSSPNNPATSHGSPCSYESPELFAVLVGSASSRQPVLLFSATAVRDLPAPLTHPIPGMFCWFN